MARTAGGIAHLHAEDRAHFFFRSAATVDALLDDRFERGAYEVLHEVGARVVARRALAVETTHEAKLPVLGTDTLLYEGSHLEDALIHRAKLLHVERRVVDLHPCTALVGKLVEGIEGTQHVAVSHAALLQPAERLRTEEHTAQRLDAQARTEVARLEEAERVHQAQPQVAVLLLAQISQLGEVAQARGGIVLLVYLLPRHQLPVVGMVSLLGNLVDQIAVLDDEEEEQAVDEVDEFLVEHVGRHRAVGDGPAQRLVALALTAHRRKADGLHRFLHGTGETGAYAVAALDAHVEPPLHDRLLVAALAEARGVEQAVHQAELRVLVLVEHAAQVKLDVGELDELSRVAQEAYGLSVADDAIDTLCGVQVFQHGGMRRPFAARALGAVVERAAVERLYALLVDDTVADDDDRQIAQLRAEVTNLIGVAACLHVGSLALQLVAQTQEEALHEVARAACAVGVVYRGALVVETPVVAQCAPHIVDGRRRRHVDREVLLAVAQHRGVLLNGAENLVGEQMAVYMNACIVHKFNV